MRPGSRANRAQVLPACRSVSGLPWGNSICARVKLEDTRTVMVSRQFPSQVKKLLSLRIADRDWEITASVESTSAYFCAMSNRFALWTVPSLSTLCKALGSSRIVS